jgi:hypothetical protein
LQQWKPRSHRIMAGSLPILHRDLLELKRSLQKEDNETNSWSVLMSFLALAPSPLAVLSRSVGDAIDDLIKLGESHMLFVREIRTSTVWNAITSEYAQKLVKCLSHRTLSQTLDDDFESLHTSEMLIRRFVDVAFDEQSDSIFAAICQYPLAFKTARRLRDEVVSDIQNGAAAEILSYKCTLLLQEQRDTLGYLDYNIDALITLFCNSSLQHLCSVTRKIVALKNLGVLFPSAHQEEWQLYFASPPQMFEVPELPPFPFNFKDKPDFRLCMKMVVLVQDPCPWLLSAIDEYMKEFMAGGPGEIYTAGPVLDRRSIHMACACGCTLVVRRALSPTLPFNLEFSVTELKEPCNRRVRDQNRDHTQNCWSHYFDANGNRIAHLAASGPYTVEVVSILIDRFGVDTFYGGSVNKEMKLPYELLSAQCMRTFPFDRHFNMAHSATEEGRRLLAHQDHKIASYHDLNRQMYSELAHLSNANAKARAAMLLKLSKLVGDAAIAAFRAELGAADQAFVSNEDAICDRYNVGIPPEEKLTKRRLNNWLEGWHGTRAKLQRESWMGERIWRV